MNTTDKKNSTLNKDYKNHNSYDRSNAVSDEFFDLDKTKTTEDSNEEIADRGYTVRDGHNPNKPNPDERYLDDEDDLNDDFHTDRDLEDNEDTIYEVELEDDDAELDIDGNELNEVNDELDNPSDDFNETEEDLEDLDQDDDEEEEEYIEDDVQEKDDNEDYPDNDPRKF
ncbi:hypothetical protein [Flavobacterium sp. FlaQc-48]|uniref:hypothetical protein n=1 Tax=Flavobacterium sp. FlaQc-48 TaxID=3374181 RepID=UPI00375748AB